MYSRKLFWGYSGRMLSWRCRAGNSSTLPARWPPGLSP